MKALSSIDALMGPLVLLLILVHAYWYGRKKAKSDDLYKRYFTGTIIKMIGSLGFMAVYILYYKEGGDTLDYHQNSKALLNLMFHDFGNFWDVMWSSKPEYMSYFTGDTGYVLKRHFIDPTTFNVSRLTAIFCGFCGGSYVATCFLLSYLCFQGLWRLYRLFVNRFPELNNGLFYTVLVIPSVIFWTGGISKEVYIICALGYAVFAINSMFVDGRKRLVNGMILVLCLYLFISIKPYVFVALFPGVIIWLAFERIVRIRNQVVKIAMVPLVMIASFALALGIWFGASGFLGEYASIDAMLEKALVTQQDLQHDRYDGNSFDIGAFEPTAEGALKKFPQASIAGLFRPFLFEANNIVMLLSGVENLVLLLFTILSLFRSRRSVQLMLNNGFLWMAVIFCVIFAFAVGLSTSNFGALVRFKVPLLPMYLGLVYILSRRSQSLSSQDL